MATYTLTGGPISSSAKSIRIRFPRFEVPSLSGTSVSSVSVTLPFRLASGYSTGNYSVTLILCTGISNSNWYEYDTSGYSYYGTDTGNSSDRIYSGYYSHVIPSSKILATTTGTISFSANQTNTPTTFTFSGLNLSTSSVGSTLGVAVLYSNSGALEYYGGQSCTGTITTSSNYTITYWADTKNEYNDWPADVTVQSGGTFTIPSAVPYRHYDYSYNYITLNYNYSGSTNGTGTITNYKRDSVNNWIDWDTETQYDRGNTYTPTKNMTLQPYYGWWNESWTTGFTLPTPTRSGYTFNGWYSASSGGTKVGSGGDNYTDTTYSTIYAQWSQSTYTYTINFNGNGNTGGSVPSPISKSGTSTSVVMGDIGSSVPTRTGYRFKGWAASTTYSSTRIAYNSTEAYGGTADYDGVSAKVTSSSWTYANYCSNTGGSSSSRTLNLYAQWEQIRYTISYNLNGGGGTTPSSQTKYYGINLTLRTTSGITTKSNTTANGYLISLDANGGSVSSTSVQVTDTITYSINGWNTNPDGAGTSYSSGGTYSVNAEATMYVKWSSTTTKGTAALPTPIRTGYIFEGWYTSASGGTKRTSGYIPSSNETLYAHWIAEKYVTTIKYFPSSATTSPTTPKVHYYDGSNWIPITTIHYYNGSSWIEVGDKIPYTE